MIKFAIWLKCKRLKFGTTQSIEIKIKLNSNYRDGKDTEMSKKKNYKFSLWTFNFMLCTLFNFKNL